MIRFTLRHLIRHWRLDLTVLLSLTLGSATLISLSGYEAVMSTQELHRTLALASPAERSLFITGSPYTFDEILYQNLQNSLGTAFNERIELRYAKLQADPQPAAHLILNRIDVYSFDSIAGHVHIVEGRLPEPIRLVEAIGLSPPQVEAVIGVHAAEQAGYQIGDRVTATSLYHRFKIVGIIEPLDADDDAWGGDLNAFQITGDTTLEDRVLPLIIAPLSMRSHLLRPIFPHQIYWRITLNRERILSENVENLRVNLINFETQAGTHGAVLTNDLIQALGDYQTKLYPVHTVLFLLSLQSMLILLIALVALASTQNQSMQMELSAFSARGASLWQMIGPLALKSFIISMFASLIFGPGLAQVLIFLWNRDSDRVALRPFPGSTWLIAAILTGAGWLAMTLPIFFASRREALREVPPQKSWVQKYSIDVYLFAFGGLLFWQLGQSGSFITHQLKDNSHLFDPLLIAGPSLMLTASGMLAIRVLPILAQSAARAVSRLHSPILHLSFLHMTHDCRGAGWVLLITGMVSAQVTFNLLFVDMQASNTGMMEASLLDEGLSKAMWLNTLTLILFTVSLFFVLIQFILRKRLEDFQVLRTLGFSQRQGWFVLHIEFFFCLLLGLSAGTILGLGFFFVLFDYMTEALASVVINPLVVNWWALAGLDTLLLFLFGAALLLPRIRMSAHELWIALHDNE
jgi:hypothetical protein